MFSEAIENFRKDRDVKLESNEKRRHGLVSEHSYYELGLKNYELLKLIRSKLLWKKKILFWVYLGHKFWHLVQFYQSKIMLIVFSLTSKTMIFMEIYRKDVEKK